MYTSGCMGLQFQYLAPARTLLCCGTCIPFTNEKLYGIRLPSFMNTFRVLCLSVIGVYSTNNTVSNINYDSKDRVDDRIQWFGFKAFSLLLLLDIIECL